MINHNPGVGLTPKLQLEHALAQVEPASRPLTGGSLFRVVIHGIFHPSDGESGTGSGGYRFPRRVKVGNNYLGRRRRIVLILFRLGNGRGNVGLTVDCLVVSLIRHQRLGAKRAASESGEWELPAIRDARPILTRIILAMIFEGIDVSGYHIPTRSRIPHKRIGQGIGRGVGAGNGRWPARIPPGLFPVNLRFQRPVQPSPPWYRP